jgi:Carbohydrate esterase, sialic acid-specific acetylesterase
MKYPTGSLGILVLALAFLHTGVHAQKLKVYILAGQSNMEGHAKISTFDYIGEDPATRPLLKEMRDSDGRPRVCDDVWISYLTGSRRGNGEGFGKLTAGYGSRKDPAQAGEKIGPEFTFGIRMGQAHAAPVLIIKTAWGGKSLHTDFRPPSAGPYIFRAKQLEQLAKKNDMEKVKADKIAATGRYYRLMIDHVKRVLGDIARVYPVYEASKGYEIAGFVWFQGWNDMVDRGTYPDRDKPGGYDEYTECMAHFIRDVRKDLAAPGMPFVIGVMGVGGPIDADGAGKKRRNRATHTQFRAGMSAPAAMAEFKGNVMAVPTAPYWDAKLSAIADKMGKVRNMGRMLRTKNKNHANKDGDMSRQEQRAYLDKYRLEVVGAEDAATWKRGASNAAYHYLGCAKTMARIGVAFADAILAMEK